jgi:pilus assembly protein CpaF
MALMAGMDITIRALREQVASALDLIVHVARLQDGSRRVTHVTEVVGMEGEAITMQDLFVFKTVGGLDERGRVLGHLSATGLRPIFVDRLAERNVRLDQSIFTPPKGEEPW